MKSLSAALLADTIKKNRDYKGLTQEELSELTGINRIMIGKIEKQNFIPSIIQFEALAKALNFEIADMFIEAEDENSFLAMRSEELDKCERESVGELFSMIMTLKQQILLRRKLGNE